MNKKVIIAGAIGAFLLLNNETVQDTIQTAAGFNPLMLLDLISLLPEPKIKTKAEKAKAEKAKAEKAKAEKAKAEKAKAEKAKAEKGKPKVSGTAAEKAGVKTSEAAAEKAGIKTSEAVAEKAGIKTSEAVAEKASIKASEAAAEKAGIKASEAAAEKAGIKAAEVAAEKASIKAAEAAAEKVAIKAAEAAAEKVAIRAAEVAAEKIAASAAEKIATRIAARIARAATTAGKIAALGAKAAASGPVGALDMLALGIIVTLQNTVKDLDTEAYKEPREGMISYSQLPEAVKVIFSLIPLIGTIGDFVFPFFEFGAGCPEGTTQEFPGSLCLPKCKEGYRALNGDIFCYKDYGPTWEDDRAHSDWKDGIATTLKKIVRTNTGVPASVCNPDQEADGGLCYNKCGEGYHGVGPLCWQNIYGVGVGTPVEVEDCPSGWDSTALTCSHYNPPVTSWNDHCVYWGLGNWSGCAGGTTGGDVQIKGRLDNGGKCSGDRERIDGLCYSKCPSDWEHVPGMPYNCRKIGSSTTTERGIGHPMNCPEGKTMDSAGLCYDAAPEGFRKSTLGMMETPCPPDSDDCGLLCNRHSYTRSGNVAFKFAIREHKGEDDY